MTALHERGNGASVNEAVKGGVTAQVGEDGDSGLVTHAPLVIFPVVHSQGESSIIPGCPWL